MTSVAYLRACVAGAMEDVAEDASQGFPRLSSESPGHQMLGAEEEKESNVTLRKERESLIVMYSHISMK